jgi:hypothetical protein
MVSFASTRDKSLLFKYSAIGLVAMIWPFHLEPLQRACIVRQQIAQFALQFANRLPVERIVSRQR